MVLSEKTKVFFEVYHSFENKFSQVVSYYSRKVDWKSAVKSFRFIGEKIKSFNNNFFSKPFLFDDFNDYFYYLELLSLKSDWELFIDEFKIIIKGSIIFPPLVSERKEKIIIFCHGVTNNRWSLFYPICLALKLGYTVVTYDARNHGQSTNAQTTLGKDESFDLNEVIFFVEKTYKPKKIGLYGFSMGASTCLFWLGYYGKVKSKVSFIICDSPFDRFENQLNHVLSETNSSDVYKVLQKKFLDYLVFNLLNSDIEFFKEINPLDLIPSILPCKLLLIHGLNDKVISWKASYNIWKKLNQNPINKKKVNLYLCKNADHGEVTFFSDYVPGSFFWKNTDKPSKFDFTSLFSNYLKKNFR